jgi:hypothetical protein
MMLFESKIEKTKLEWKADPFEAKCSILAKSYGLLLRRRFLSTSSSS